MKNLKTTLLAAGLTSLLALGYTIAQQGSGIQGGGGAGGTPGGSDGQVQYNNDGSFGGIGEGTSGQVLTSNGAGMAPSFQDGVKVETGTWATTLSGFTPPIAVTFNWTKQGNLVTLTLAGSSAVTGTSTSTSLSTAADMPSAIQPANTGLSRYYFVPVMNNGSNVMALANVESTAITFGTIGASPGFTLSNGGFASSGTKGINTVFSLTYSLTGT